MRKYIILIMMIMNIAIVTLLSVTCFAPTVSAEGITQEDLNPKNPNVILSDGVKELLIGIKGDGLPELGNEMPQRKFKIVQFNETTRIEEVVLSLYKWDRSYYQDYVYGFQSYAWFYRANEVVKEMYYNYLSGKGGRCYLLDESGNDIDIVSIDLLLKKGYIDAKTVTLEKTYLGNFIINGKIQQWRSGLMISLNDPSNMYYGNSEKTEIFPENFTAGDILDISNAKFLNGIRIDYSFPRKYLKDADFFEFGKNNMLPYVFLSTYFNGTAGSGNFGVETDALYHELATDCGEWDILCWIGNGLLYLLFKVPILKDISSFFAYIYQFIEGLFGFMGIFGVLGVFASIIIGIFLLRVVLKFVVR